MGDPDYYTEFDYQIASKFNIRAPFDITDEAFMIKPLVLDGLKDASGIIEYPKAFKDYWDGVPESEKQITKLF